MAGVQAGSAGRLSIEIVAEIARLQSGLDRAKRAVNAASGDIAKSARAANDNLSKIGSGAGAGVREFARDVAALKAQLDPAWQAQQRYNQQVELGARAFKAGAIDRQQFIQHMRQINAELKGVQQPMQRVTTAAGAQRAGMQQLSFQLNDVATQFSSGTPPMQIFAQQAGQTVQAVQLMGGGMGRLAAFMSGPWGMAVVAATVVLVPFIARLFESAAAADTARNALQSLIEKQRQQAAEATSLVQAQIGQNKAREELLALEIKIADRRAQNRKYGGQEDAFLFKELKRQKELQWELAEAAGAVTVAQNAEAESTKKATAAVSAAVPAGRAHAAGVSDSARSYEQAVSAGQSYIEQLQREVAEFGKSEKELRLMEVARRMEAAATDEQRAAIQRLSDVREMQMGADKLSKEMKQAAEWRAAQVGNIEKEIKLLGLVGAARDKAALALEEEAFLADALANHVSDAVGAWEEYRQKQLDLINGKSLLDEENRKAEILADRVNALSSTLGGLGGGVISDAIYALTSRDPTAALLGMGGIGSIIGMMTPGGQEALGAQRKAMTQALESVMGPNSSNIASGIAGILQGAGTGLQVAGVVGNGSSGANIGGAIGGALGQAIGGPIGSIIGSIGGSLLGGLFKQAKSKANVITQAGQSGTFGGTGGDYTRAADALSQSVLDSLDKLAEALGATADGAFKLSIGMRDGNFVVNPGGGGTKSSMGAVNFGKDEAGAIAFAIQDAISDGVFKGLGEGVERLLKSGGDLETQLQKALSFKGVFDELEQMRNPQAFDEKQLDSWRAGMDKIFAEAGATAQQLADLEELTGLKRKEIAEKYASDTTELERTRRQMEIALMELSGNAAGALAASRQLELEQMDASLHGLARQIYAQQDLIAEQDRAARAAEELARATGEARERMDALLVRLLDAQGNDIGARDLQRQQELARAQGEVEQSMLRQIYAAEDLARATSEATAAANAAAEAQERLGALQLRLLDARGDTAGAQALRRAQEMAQAQSDTERAMLAQIYAAEDLRVQSEAAQRAIEEAASKFSDLAKNLRDYSLSLMGSTANGPMGYRTAQVEFMKQAALASAGDQGGLAALQGASAAYLEVSRAQSTASQYQRDFANVLASLDQAARVAESLSAPGAATITGADGAGSLREVAVTITDGNASLKAEIIELRKEVAKMHADNNAGHAATAGNTGRIDRTLTNVTAQSGGDAIATVASA